MEILPDESGLRFLYKEKQTHKEAVSKAQLFLVKK